MTQPVEASRGARWMRFVPIAGWLPQYRRRLIVGDILAGLVVAALAIPQSLGYAGIAGVPIIVGLYSIPLALIAYAVLGSSPHLVVGPVSTVSVLSGTLVLDLSHGDPATADGPVTRSRTRTSSGLPPAASTTAPSTSVERE